jgi:hypothetical protein
MTLKRVDVLIWGHRVRNGENRILRSRDAMRTEIPQEFVEMLTLLQVKELRES